MKYKRIFTANTGDDTLNIIDCSNKINIEQIELNKLSLKEKRIGPLKVIRDNGNLLLINSLDDSLFKINIKEKTLLKSIKMGRYPIDIILYKEKIYVLNSDSSSLFIIDREKLILLESISIGGKLTDIEIDKRNEIIYIGNWDRELILKYNIKTNRIEEEKYKFKPIKMVVEERYMFILSFINDNYVNYCRLSKLDLNNDKIINHVEIKGFFFDFVKIYGKEKFHLVDGESSSIYELDYKNRIILQSKYIGGLPNKIIFDKDSLYVNDLINNMITILDINNYKIKDKIRVGKEPQGIFLL